MTKTTSKNKPPRRPPGRRPRRARARTSSNTQVTAHLTHGSPHARPVHSMQLHEHFLGSRSGHLASPRPVDAACEASLLPTAAARACSRIGARRSRPHSCGYCAGPWPWSPPPDDHSIALTWPTRGAVPRRLRSTLVLVLPGYCTRKLRARPINFPNRCRVGALIKAL